MDRFQNKHILLGVTGSIAAYKAGEIVRRLREAGAEVRVVMTEGANAFVTPLTFQALSGYPVYQELLDNEAEAGMGHIELSRWADAILIAPASADFMARLRQGRAADLLTAICLASKVPLALAPAMNVNMWQAAATQDNVKTLQQRGMVMLGPVEGEQACGDVGSGRMLEPLAIVEQLAELFASGSLSGKTVLVTAGPTREAIDPVRYLSNHSSGKMGFALAQAAAEAGARVILVSGPVQLATPPHVERIDVISAQDMFETVMNRIGEVDIFIAAAAVADYRPLKVADDKVKKQHDTMTLKLERTPDILATVKQHHPAVFCVGFAAETSELEHYARSKLSNKGIEMVAANWVGAAASETQGTFDSDTNALKVFWVDGEAELAVASKSRIACELLQLVVPCYERFLKDKLANKDNVVTLQNR
ncbi:MAG: bifunctional phosphopantothenoylcysteine decarboxylase/phosphopantothenate--cysteine ligase CoaBC [Thioalkalispiraceae bacterium]|jgi:phosphopantothenoylcysteine decarboxylase/phosphopantothenate--cysteine ligase